mgnify:CR=1 FL=1
MLVIRCAACKTKLYRYLKIGPGKVLRCHKARIKRIFNKPVIDADGSVRCPKCGTVFAKDGPKYLTMIRDGFTYTGTKE